MFRPVQNPDDEEVEGRVRTRTRTKELVYYTHLILLAHQRREYFNCLLTFPLFSTSFFPLAFLCSLTTFFPLYFFLLTICILSIPFPSSSFCNVSLHANDGGAERAKSTQARQRQQQPRTGRQRTTKPPEITQLGQ